MSVGPPTLTHLIARERSHMAPAPATATRRRRPTAGAGPPVVRGRAAVVQARGVLRDPHPRLLRRQRRRLGRLPRTDREARLPAVARHRLHLAAPLLPLTTRDGGYDIADFTAVHPDYGNVDDVHELIDAAHARRIRVIADLVMNHTSSEHPWFQESRSSAGLAQARLVRVVGHGPSLRGRADHLHRHRDLELDVGRDGRRLLLAPLLLPPARPQLRQPRGPGGDARGAPLLARPRPRRVPARRRAVPVRARGDDLREPATRPTRT